MAETSLIEWTDATWNPITGCTLVSEGCRHCYAARLAATRMQHHPSRAGLARLNAAGEAKFTGEVRFNEGWLDQPLGWRKPRRIFVCAHGDLFHEGVPDEWIDRIFAVMALAPQHTFQVLTKRPERAREYLARRRPYAVARAAIDLFIEGRVPKTTVGSGHWPVASEGDPDSPDDVTIRCWPLPNVWLGTSVEDQDTADVRIPHLLDAPAAVRFLSAEPLIGPLDLERIDPKIFAASANALTGVWRWDGGPSRPETPGLDWVIVGGESGRGARPMHPDWARSLRDQCVAAGVPFFFKQWGAWAPICEIGEADDLYHPAPPRDPEAARRLRHASLVLHADGSVHDLSSANGFHRSTPTAFTAGSKAMLMFDIGKAAAGRLLDGRTWDEMPGQADA